MIRDKIRRVVSGLRDLVWDQKPEKKDDSGSKGVVPLNRRGRRLIQMEIGRLTRKNVRRTFRLLASAKGTAIGAHVRFHRMQV